MEGVAIRAVCTNPCDNISAETGTCDAKFQKLTDDFEHTNSDVRQLEKLLGLGIHFDDSVLTDIHKQMKQVGDKISRVGIVRALGLKSELFNLGSNVLSNILFMAGPAKHPKHARSQTYTARCRRRWVAVLTLVINRQLQDDEMSEMVAERWCNHFYHKTETAVALRKKFSTKKRSPGPWKAVAAHGMDKVLDIALPMAWFPKTYLRLLYRGTRDGFGLNNFHRHCDNKGSTMVCIRTDKGCVFGGYTPVNWEPKISTVYHASGWLFTLKNRYGKSPTQMKPYRNKKYSVHCEPGAVSFGKWKSDDKSSVVDVDLKIADNPNLNTESSVRIGGTYKLPDGRRKSFCNNGSKNFKIQEIEVYQVC